MNHAVLVNGEPVRLTGETVTLPDGSWLPVAALDNMSRADKLSLGIYEVEAVNVGSGPVLVSGPVDTDAGDHVAATYTYREMTAQEIDAFREAQAVSEADVALAKMDFRGLDMVFQLWREAKGQTLAQTVARFRSPTQITGAQYKDQLKDLL